MSEFKAHHNSTCESTFQYSPAGPPPVQKTFREVRDEIQNELTALYALKTISAIMVEAPHRKIARIKVIREKTGLCLRDAKEIIDTFNDQIPTYNKEPDPNGYLSSQVKDDLERRVQSLQATLAEKVDDYTELRKDYTELKSQNKILEEKLAEEFRHVDRVIKQAENSDNSELKYKSALRIIKHLAQSSQAAWVGARDQLVNRILDVVDLTGIEEV